MLIKQVTIKNYKSLLNTELKDLSNLVVLVGGNSSGKSNLLEALWLFFKDFSLTLTGAIDIPLKSHERMWFEENIDSPIEFMITIEFSKEEGQKILPPEYSSEANEKLLVKIHRQIKADGNKMLWETVELFCGDIVLIKGNRKRTPKQFDQSKKIDELTSKLMELDEKLSKIKKTNTDTYDPTRPDIFLAPNSRYQFSSDESKNVINFTSLSTNPLNPDIYMPTAYARSAEGEIENEKKILSEKIQELRESENIKTKKLIDRIEKEIANKINYLPASRDNISGEIEYGIRPLIIQNSTNSDLIENGDSLSDKRKKWKRLKSSFDRLTSNQGQLTIAERQVVVEEASYSSPLSLTGTGIQEIVELLHKIQTIDKPIAIIEEPEQHLHADLAKKLLSEFKTIAKEKQIWISTHSPFFLDKVDIRNVCSLTVKNGRTEVLQLIDKNELRQAMSEMGVRASDILFANALILVDGPTEVDILPIWAKTLGVDLDQLGVVTLSIGGGSKEKPNLRMWREITRNAQIPIFMLLDNHSQADATKMVEDGLIDNEHCIVFKAHSIEEYYPKEDVLKGIDAEWAVKVQLAEINSTKSEDIATLLLQKGILKGDRVENFWKPLLGLQVAKLMKKSEIPEEVKKLIDNLKSAVQAV